MRLGFLGLILITALFSSCRKEGEQMYIVFSPTDDVIAVDQDSTSITLNLFAGEGLASLNVYLGSENEPERSVLSKSFSGSKSENINVNLVFTPDFNRGTSVYGKFVLTDNTGKRLEYLKRFDLSEELSLSLHQNVSFFSRHSELYNAFSFNQVSAITLDGINNQGLADLVELSNDTANNPFQLSYRWYSPSNCVMAHAPNLNFYEVSAEQLKAVFDASEPLSFTDSLEVGDIYVFKKLFPDNPRYYAVKLKSFESGSTPGKYVFDLRR
jgi:hypothetical protein